MAGMEVVEILKGLGTVETWLTFRVTDFEESSIEVIRELAQQHGYHFSISADGEEITLSKPL